MGLKYFSKNISGEKYGFAPISLATRSKCTSEDSKKINRKNEYNFFVEFIVIFLNSSETYQSFIFSSKSEKKIYILCSTTHTSLRGLCPQATDAFRWNSPSQLVTGYHWLAFLNHAGSQRVAEAVVNVPSLL